MDFHEWLKIGLDKGWVSDVKCSTHDGLPGTPEEDAAWEEGHDPCVPALRVW